MTSILFTEKKNGERDVFELKQVVLRSWHGLALKNLTRDVIFNDNKPNAMYKKKLRRT